MGQEKICIVDYGAGNLRSVVNAITWLGHEPVVTSSAADLAAARLIVLPGVGAATAAMRNLEALGLADAIRQVIMQNRPFLGICLGLQLLFTATEEGEGQECLGIFPGRVGRLPSGLKIPHMGWNQVRQKVNHPIFSGIPDDANFYFVHSYYAEPVDRSVVAGETDYGATFCSVLARGNVVATQFHPEKSGDFGLRFYANFISLGQS